MWRRAFQLIGFVLVALVLAQMLRLEGHPHRARTDGFVGSLACAGCHAAQANAWAHSHHAHALTRDAAQFLGDFNSATASDRGASIVWNSAAHGLTATLDGRTVPVREAIGIYPLQQYLADMPNGAKQILPLAWDARPQAEGGQRWFNPARAGAPAWTSRDETWNFMCVDCHATDVARHYVLSSDTYHTDTSEDDVGCEACHGAGAAHVAWAAAGANKATGPALAVRPPQPGGRWSAFDAATGIRHWLGPPRGDAALDMCAPCHSRRQKLADRPPVGATLLNHYEPALLDAGLYQADGQILDEDFEYGSFLQSRMYQNGVTCTDCHDAHSFKPVLDGNALCGQCHDATRFDTPAHFHHAPGTDGARCTSCHMPTRTYMGVHVRHDHGLRVPRPDLAAQYGTTDACTACHVGRAPAWAADAIRSWRGDRPPRRAGAADALAASRQSPGRAAEFATDTSLPAIVRATLLTQAAQSENGTAAEIKGANDSDPLLRLAAARSIPPEAQDVLRHLARDHVLAVRITAARRIPNEPAAASALAEWRAAQQQAADRPESHLNLGALLADQGRADAAEAEFRTALRLAPDFAPAMIDLADLSRARGDEAKAEQLLRAAVAADDTNAEAWYALGLSLIRQHREQEATQCVRRAVGLRPEDGQYAHVLQLLKSD